MSLLKPIIKRMYENLFYKEIEQNNKLIGNLNQQISDLKIANEKMAIRKNIPQPQVLGTIQLVDVYKLLSPLCKDIYLSDEYFSLTSMEEASIFSESTKVQYQSWVAESHDCDNFSFALLGYWSDSLKSFAFGTAWSNKHAFNLMIDNSKHIWICEPQTNKWTKWEDISNDMYSPLRLIIM